MDHCLSAVAIHEGTCSLVPASSASKYRRRKPTWESGHVQQRQVDTWGMVPDVESRSTSL